jgi:hypothetical protein
MDVKVFSAAGFSGVDCIGCFCATPKKVIPLTKRSTSEKLNHENKFKYWFTIHTYDINFYLDNEAMLQN